VKRKKKKLIVTHAHPCFTKYRLNILLFLAKYEGAVLATCECVMALYGAARADGSRRAKREPATSVAGKIARRTVSREVGRSGCLRDDMFGELEVAVLEVEGADSGVWFWVLCERRGVTEPESMTLDAIRKNRKVYNMRQTCSRTCRQQDDVEARWRSASKGGGISWCAGTTEVTTVRCL
jgi:hypothetical protein